MKRIWGIVGLAVVSLVVAVTIGLQFFPNVKPTDTETTAALPELARRVLDQGRRAAEQEAWLTAIDYFDQARRAVPMHPGPLYYLGLAEAQIPGRELRAMCWLEAFIALAPRTPEASSIRRVIDRELEVKARANYDRLYALLKQFNNQMDFDAFRRTELDWLDDLTTRRNSLPTVPAVSSSPATTAVARWQARRWIDLVEKRMNIPSFVDFESALSAAKEGRTSNWRYPEYSYQSKMEPLYAYLTNDPPTPAQKQLDHIFDAVRIVADDSLAGLGDVLNTQLILRNLQPALAGVPIAAVLGPWPCVTPFSSNGLAAVTASPERECSSFQRWGFIDRAGAFVIQPEFGAESEPGIFSEGLASLGNRFIDRQGEVKFAQQKWCCASEFREGVAVVQEDDKAGFIDRAGNVTARVWDAASPFSEDFARVARGTKWGFVDKAAKLVLPLQWDIPPSRGRWWLTSWAGGFTNGRALVQKANKWGFIGRTGAIAVALDWDHALPFHDGLAVVGRAGKSGFIDPSGKLAIPLIYDDADSFSEGLAFVRQGAAVSVIDKTGKIVFSVPGKCSAVDSGDCIVRPFADGLAWITIQGVDQFIEKGAASVIGLPRQFPTIYGHSERKLLIGMKETYRGRLYEAKGFVELGTSSPG